MRATLPWHSRRRFTPRMRYLNSCDSAMLLKKNIISGKWLNLLIIPQASAARSNTALWRNRGRLGYDQACATHCSRPKLYQVPIVG